MKIDYNDQIQFDYLFAEYINLTNDSLFDLTKKPTYDIIKDIRKKYKQYGQMSKKQREVLARYLAFKEL